MVDALDVPVNDVVVDFVVGMLGVDPSLAEVRSVIKVLLSGHFIYIRQRP